MTDLVGHVTAKQIAGPHAKLAEAVTKALWNERMSHGHRDPYITGKDLDAVLEAATELLFVISEHVRPRCPKIMPDTAAWRCAKPEGHEGHIHGDSIMTWSD